MECHSNAGGRLAGQNGYRMYLMKVVSLLFAALVLAGCLERAADITPALPPASQEILSIYLAEELEPLAPVLHACAQTDGGYEILLFYRLAPPEPEEADELSIVLGEPASLQEYPVLLGWEQIVVVTGSSRAATPSTPEAVKAYFSGQIAGWPGGGEVITVWVPLAGSAARLALDAFMAGQGYAPDAGLAPNPRALLEVLEEDPDAIGALPAAWLTGEALAIEIFELVRLPVVVLSTVEPLGSARRLLGCLQENARGLYD